ncbi:hypothetical protein HCN44_001351 [Aphidius gifuensis]|uniref:TIMELESS-interacting protein n=1 Tax=Aphidius gifuensis TaxID=684658 RepID=A0A834XWD5_APHGI|nr:hypothetical protein HCN44_001351 [Aphidius gifuensis]
MSHIGGNDDGDDDGHVALSDNEHSDNERQNNHSDNHDSNNDNDNDNDNARRIDPTASRKKRIVRNPQVKLNAERLRGAKGVQTIEEYFKGFKWQGKNHEASDLNKIMKRMEHWGHRLYPKYNFDDLLDKLSILGAKREVQVFLTKYRKNMLNDDLISTDVNNLNDDDDNNDNNDDNVNHNFNNNNDNAEQSFSQEPSLSSLSQVNNNNNNNNNNSASFENTNLSSTIQPQSKIINDEETKKRIERNRQMALAKRMSRIKANLEETKETATSQLQLQILDNNYISTNETIIMTNDNQSQVEFETTIENKKNNDTTIIDNNSSQVDSQQQQQHDDDNNYEKEALPNDEVNSSHENLLSNVSSSIVDEDPLINTYGKRPLTNDELDEEIDKVVNNFIRKRQTK